MPVDPPSATLPAGIELSADLRRATADGTGRSAAALPTTSANARGAEPAPPLATPTRGPGELARVTESTFASEATVARGGAWTAVALCRAGDTGRTATWDVTPVATGTGDGAGAGADNGDGGGGGIATGTVRCDGRPARVGGRWAVSGAVVLRLEPDGGLPRRVVVILGQGP